MSGDVNSIGFWVALFQPDTAKNRVKVWLDGAEDYTIFPIEEFVALGAATGMKELLRAACREYSFFLWRVKDKIIKRVSFKENAPSLQQEILQGPSSIQKKASIDEKYSKVSVDLDEKTNSVKIII